MGSDLYYLAKEYADKRAGVYSSALSKIGKILSKWRKRGYREDESHDFLIEIELEYDRMIEEADQYRIK